MGNAFGIGFVEYVLYFNPLGIVEVKKDLQL